MARVSAVDVAHFESARTEVSSERVPDEPPTKEPNVPLYERPEPRVTEDVATFAKVFTPEKYGMFPTTAAVLVERPLKVNAPLEELYARGNVAEREEEEILLLKVVKSVEERKPLDAVPAWVMVRLLPAKTSGRPLSPRFGLISRNTPFVHGPGF